MAQNTNILDYFNLFWFAVLPYVALFTFLLVTIQRYTRRGFTYSSLSSQFLENKIHFWGLVPFHYGILTILFGHLLGFLIPRQVLLWNSDPLRLHILEVTAFIGGIFTLVGLVNIVIRRLVDPRAKVVTSTADWVVLSILLFQIGTGLFVAIFNSWGSSWFAASITPYFWSLLAFSPDIAFVTPMPMLVKLHIISAYFLILLFPFTRLVHVLVIPNPYLWRKPQLVRWYWDRKKIRTPGFKAKRK